MLKLLMILLNGQFKRVYGHFVALLLVTILTAVSLASEKASAQAGPAFTVGQFISSMESLVKTLESSARSLLDQGNNVAAQQQMLLAGTLQGTIQQLREAYKDSLNKTFDGLETQQGNAFKRLQAALQDASRLENRSSSDLNQIVSNTQNAANQLMDRMPLTDKSPVYFGIQTRDVLGSFDQQPNDIVITGYHLVDSRLNNRKPDIQIAANGKSYNLTKDHPDNIAPQFDKILVSLPDDLRETIRIENQACKPMRLFHLTGIVYYKGGWFNTDQKYEFNANMSPGERLYTIKVTIDGSRTSTQPVQSNFSNVSDQVNVGCETAGSTTVVWNSPEKATQITPKAAWINTDKLKTQSANAVVTGTTVSATGTISGLDKQCVPIVGACNCPGGGHGSLQVSGTYVLDQPVTTDFHDERSVVHVNPTHISIPSETILTLKKVEIEIARKGCPEVLDRIHIAVPSDQNKVIQANSDNGYFTATLQPGQVDVVTTALAPDADHH